jgi:hypothetical protein
MAETTQTLDEKLNNAADAELKRRVQSIADQLWDLFKEVQGRYPNAGHLDHGGGKNTWVGGIWRDFTKAFPEHFNKEYRDMYKERFIAKLESVSSAVEELQGQQ